MIRSVLIVDDEPSDRLVASRVMRKLVPDIAILEFANGADAFGFVRDRREVKARCGPFPPPTLVLMDINMPIMGGFEFLERLEGLIAAGDVHGSWFTVSMFTSSSNPRDREKAASIPCVRDFIVKPLTETSFGTLLEKHFPGQS